MKQKQKIILASKSPSRALILQGAGVSFEAVPADIPESRIIAESLKTGIDPKEIGQLLAQEKARAVSRTDQCRDLVVLGADQILLLEDEIFEKPANMDEARQTLLKLRGRTHTLVACVAAYLNGEKIFEMTDEAHLTMRDFSDEFLDEYLEKAGEKILSSVGAYQLEAEGAQLFNRINGDFFTILGLPLLPVLDFLHERGVLDA